MVRKIEDTCQLEICCFDLESVRLAEEEGIASIEFCTDYLQGGLWPGVDLIQASRTLYSGEMRVMIRPRPGDFIYSEQEITVMRDQVGQAMSLGVDGITFGCLTPDGRLAAEHLQCLMEASLPSTTWTFHRALDLIRDVPTALEYLVTRGVHRVLTSGGRSRAVDALSELQQYREVVQDQMQIVAAGKVRPDQIPLFRKAGCASIHSAATERPDGRADVNLIRQLKQQWCNSDS